ncbi:MAG: hypothetical protein F4X42_03570, partial [Rhodospirillaceae bacterium]|nr:hypothetical protein [Rhodospirillaceae bacterium]
PPPRPPPHPPGGRPPPPPPPPPRAGARARPGGRRCRAGMVRQAACPMSPHRAARLSCPAGPTAPRRS